MNAIDFRLRFALHQTNAPLSLRTMLLTTKKLILTMTAAFGLASFAAPVLSQSTAPSAKTAASSMAKKTSAGKGKAVKTTAKRTTKKASAKRTSIKKSAKKTKKATS